MIYLFTFVFAIYTSIPSKTSIDAQFEPYLRVAPSNFAPLMADSHLIVKFDEIKDDETVGYCSKSFDFLGNITRRLIVIDKLYWGALSYKARQLLLWHELGHCLFNKKHDESFMHDGCPKNIMYPTILSDRCIDRHYDIYLQQIL